LSLVGIVCCQVEVSASDVSLVQRSPTECGVSSECDREPRNQVEVPQKKKRSAQLNFNTDVKVLISSLQNLHGLVFKHFTCPLTEVSSTFMYYSTERE